jgi:hypothetical protein
MESKSYRLHQIKLENVELYLTDEKKLYLTINKENEDESVTPLLTASFEVTTSQHEAIKTLTTS